MADKIEMNKLNFKWNVPTNIIYNSLDDEIIIMNTMTDNYIILDPIGSHIWELLTKQSLTIEELTTQLIKEYEVDKETCMKDVQDFIDDMASKKLIIPVEQENPPEK